MGIKVEFNPDLALRKTDTLGRLEEECIPKKLEAGSIYNFLKEGQRVYWLEGEIPLLITEGNQELSRPIASITILENTHFIDCQSGKLYTRGRYKINEIYDVKN
jgi:hypothetical protein